MTIDLNKHKEAYLKEANSYIKVMNRALIQLEKTPDLVKFFREIFHAVHTFKSLAATMNYEQSINLCHVIEDILDAIKNKKISLDKCVDPLFHSFDHLNTNLKRVEENKNELDSNSLITQLQSLLDNQKNAIENTISPSSIESEAVEKTKAIEVKVERLDILMNLAEELLVCKMKFDSIKDKIDNSELNSSVESLERIIRDLQYHVMQVRLMPVEYIFNRFYRMTRDIAKQQNKEIDLQTEGSDIELDRLIIDEISESIGHLIRNAIDHGLETPEIRIKKNKSPRGTIRLSASRTKDLAVIEISDDGSGLNLSEIKSKAVKTGLIKEDADDNEVINIIFENISTKKSVTEISGRGLGLSIAKEKIESIGGTIRVESEADKGTSFFVEIPISLAIIKMLFVRVAEQIYAIPIDVVERLLIVNSDDFKGLLNYEAIIFEEHEIPVIKLAKLLGGDTSQQIKHPVVIVHKGKDRLGIAVDSLVATQEIVVKPLGKAVKSNKYFSGAAIIGSGEVVLILDVSNLLNAIKGK